MSGVRRHVGHSPHCQAQTLQNVAARHVRKNEEHDELPIQDNPPDVIMETAGWEGYQDDHDGAIAAPATPDATAGHEGGQVRPHDLSSDESQPSGTDDPVNQRYIHEYDEGSAAEVLGYAKTSFEVMKDSQEAAGQGIYAPFADRQDWELAEWLTRNVNQRATDEFLKLPITRERTQPSYRSSHTFMNVIDQLPTGPEWQCDLVRARGDADYREETGDTEEGEDEANELEGEELELWWRDPVACVRELIGNAAFKDEMAYAPEKVYTDCQGQTRRYDEMWTAEWWWKTQSRLPAGATVSPILLASDKTQLSRFKGDKVAWPIYLTIGNISNHVRRQPARHASILLGYLPVSKLDSFDNTSVAGYRLFHYCMKRIVDSLVATGLEGVEMVCADGLVRRVYPVLAAFIGDHPEQCLVACCAENRCPKCHVPADQRGANFKYPSRDQAQTTRVLRAQAAGEYPPEFIAEGLRPVFSPFWAKLPHSDIFCCITSDILHQLHQGIIKDHLKKWCTAIAGKRAFDARFQATPFHPGLRHFKAGISPIKQWTGGDHKELERVFLNALVGTTPNTDVLRASGALLDFVYLARYLSHTDDTLQALQTTLNTFHREKDVFILLGCREHFNLPKLHALSHYVDSIRLFGSLDGFNTENSERLHIDYAKKAYAASNRKDYKIQMTRWLNRQEAVSWFRAYLAWYHSSSAVGAENDHSDGFDDSSANAEQASHVQAYRIAQRPQFPKRTVQSLVQFQGAVGFVDALRAFVTDLDPGCRTTFQPTIHDHIDCFSNVRIPLLPLVHSSGNEMARIRCHPECANGPRKPPTPARYDTVLVQVDAAAHKTGGFHGLRVAEVRVVFMLPPHLGIYPHPLAYVHWFKPLRTFDNNLQMFRLGRSTRNHLPNAAVVPVTHLVQPCHLVPQFPSGALDPRWVRGDSGSADSFFLNKYIDLRTFEQYREHGDA